MTAPRGLRAHLASLSPAGLQLLLDARPDVLRGAPLRDLDDLAGRLANPNGVGSALLGATWAQLQVLEALTACGAGASHRRAAEILSPAGSGYWRGNVVKASRPCGDQTPTPPPGPPWISCPPPRGTSTGLPSSVVAA